MRDWLTHHAWQLTGVSVLLVAAGLAVATILIVRMPEDYFLRNRAASEEPPSARRILRRLSKNGLAMLLAMVGIVLSLPMVPGPGLLLLLIALSLADFPSKRRLEIRIVKNPLVLRPANTLRAMCGRRPLRLPSDGMGNTH